MGLNIEALAKARGLWSDGGGAPWGARRDAGRRPVIWCTGGAYQLRWWTPDTTPEGSDMWVTAGILDPSEDRRIGDDVTAALLVLLHEIEPWPVTCPRCRGDRDRACDCDPKTRMVPGPAWSQALLDACKGVDVAHGWLADAQAIYEGDLHAREQLHALADWLSEQDRTCPACKRRSLPGRKLAKWEWRLAAGQAQMYEAARQGWRTGLGWKQSEAARERQRQGLVPGARAAWPLLRACPRCIDRDGEPTGIDPAGPHALGEALALWLDAVPCQACGGEMRVLARGWRDALVPCSPCAGTGCEVVARLRSMLATLD